MAILAIVAYLQASAAQLATAAAVKATAKYDVIKAAVESEKNATVGTATITSSFLSELEKSVASNVQPKRVLWLDKPDKNVNEAAALEKMGLRIDFVQSVWEAVNMASNGYDLIITRFGRQGDRKQDSVAYTLQAALGVIATPVIIYSSGVKPEYACSAQQDGFYDEMDQPGVLFSSAIRSANRLPANSRCRPTSDEIRPASAPIATGSK